MAALKFTEQAKSSLVAKQFSLPPPLSAHLSGRTGRTKYIRIYPLPTHPERQQMGSRLNACKIAPPRVERPENESSPQSTVHRPERQSPVGQVLGARSWWPDQSPNSIVCNVAGHLELNACLHIMPIKGDVCASHLGDFWVSVVVYPSFHYVSFLSLN